MRDDERYPTVVSTGQYHDAPEVVSQPPLDYEGRDKVTTSTGLHDGGHKADEPAPPAVEASGKPRTCCGMKRRTFFIVLAVVVVVIIGGVVGGVVGGLKAGGLNADGSSSDSDSDSDSGSGSEPTGKPSTTSSGPIQPSQRAVAVSSSSGPRKQDIQVFYQDLDSTDILFRRVKNDKSQSEHTVSLDITPNRATALSAAAVNGTSPVVVQLFYAALDSDDKMAIAEARLECASDSADCNTMSNSLIPSDVTGEVHDETRLAALRFGTGDIRVFYQTSNGDIQALSGGEADDNDWSTYRLTSGAENGTAIAASALTRNTVNVFYVSKSGDLRRVQYDDILGPGKGVDVDDNPGSQWSPEVSLASTVNTTRVYYAQPSHGVIVSYFEKDEKPTLLVNHDDSWGRVDGGLAVTTWSSGTRLFYFDGGDLFMSAQANAAWRDAQNMSG